MPSLFDLALDFIALSDLSNELNYDEETGEIINEDEALTELFESVNLQLTDKLDNTSLIIKQMEANAQMLDEESKRLQRRKITLNNRVALLRELMLGALKASNQTKLKTAKFNYSIRKSKSVQVADVEELPRNMVRLKREADKMKIKEALSNGEEIVGCSFVEKETLGFK